MIVKKILTTIDTHTAGGPTRIVVGGIPPLHGVSVAEKMAYFQSHFDSIRKLLMCEPRGHKDMAGAVITEPTHLEADVGSFFLTSSGYLPACVHSSIGVATAGLEAGFIGRTPELAGRSIKMETPAGLISLFPEFDGEKVQSVAIQTQPAFVHTSSTELRIGPGGPLTVSIVFSGVFFILLDVKQENIPANQRCIVPENVKGLTALGVRVLEEANRSFELCHPEHLTIDSAELVMIYEELENRRARDIVINQDGVVDRSPCGAGTGAKITYLFTLGKLKAHDEYINESFLGTRFVGRVLRPAMVGSYEGAVPEIRGTAFITGMHQFMLDSGDPLSEGFVF